MVNSYLRYKGTIFFWNDKIYSKIFLHHVHNSCALNTHFIAPLATYETLSFDTLHRVDKRWISGG